MNRFREWTILALAMWTVCGPPEVGAQEQKVTPTVLTIRPAKAPVPALKYRLVPERRELVPGNAASFYHRACLMAASWRSDQAVKEDETVTGWLGGAAKDIQREEAQRYVNRLGTALHEAELGAFREECDWQYDRREEGYALLLPEIQAIRQVGRAVVLKARLEILDGHPEQAMHWIEVGFTISRHLGETPFLISNLVGIAISSQLKLPLEDLMGSPFGPNLYWSFATRPRPLVDMQRALEGERYALERELPELAEVDGTAWSNERARIFGDDLFAKLKGLTDSLRMIAPAGAKAGAAAPRMEDLPSRLALAAIVARVYPEAKRALIAGGRTPADVESMPSLQVVLIHTLRAYRQFRDDIFKWTAFPYWQAGNRTDAIWKGHRELHAKLSNPLLAMFTALMPATASASLASARLERQFDAFQCVEAIRMYAADHDGKLPESLDAMTETPVPIDPVIGKPFEYAKVDDTTATLSATYPPGGPKIPQYLIRYELKLTK